MINIKNKRYLLKKKIRASKEREDLGGRYGS